MWRICWCNAGFLSLETMDMWGWIILCCTGECQQHPWPLLAGCGWQPALQLRQLKVSPDIANHPWGAKSALVKSRCCNGNGRKGYMLCSVIMSRLNCILQSVLSWMFLVLLCFWSPSWCKEAAGLSSNLSAFPPLGALSFMEKGSGLWRMPLSLH